MLHTTKDGASLPLREFSSPATGRKITGGLIEAGLIKCIDWDSWKPTDWDVGNAKGRRFLPTAELILANAGREVVDSFADYWDNRFHLRESRQESEVVLCPGSGVCVSDNVIRRLAAGTGLRFDLGRALAELDDKDEFDRAKLLHAANQGVGFLGNVDEVHTKWEQKKCGRLYSSGPAVLNMPRCLRSAWAPADGRIISEVDFRSFETNLLFLRAGLDIPDHDFFAQVAGEIGVTRDELKNTFNPMLHGQTRGNLVAAENWTVLEIRERLEHHLQRHLPKLWTEILFLREDTGFLHRRGAEVFFNAYDRALAAEDLPAGIPLHDGWVFPAKDATQARRVRGIFTEASAEVSGCLLPVELRINGLKQAA